jgi:hypothetical protein
MDASFSASGASVRFPGPRQPVCAGPGAVLYWPPAVHFRMCTELDSVMRNFLKTGIHHRVASARYCCHDNFSADPPTCPKKYFVIVSRRVCGHLCEHPCSVPTYRGREGHQLVGVR